MNIVNKKSVAGKLGAASRWKDHKHIKSKLARIYQDDFDFISGYCSNADIPFIVAFHRLCAFVIHRHGYSAFMVGERILKSQ